MNASHLAIDDAISQIDTLKKTLRKSSSLQVRAVQERSIIKATALAWFNNVRPRIAASANNEALLSTDNLYNKLLIGSERATTRSDYIDKIKLLKQALVDLRSQS